MVPEDKETGISCLVKIIDNGKRNIKGKGELKLRGNNTSSHVKSPYKIKFEKAINLLDMPSKSKKWNLLANFYDKSLLRTSVAMKISEIFEMKYTPQCRIVDVIINGEYIGNYYLCDKVEVRKGRIEVTEIDETCTEEPEISGGYMIEVNNYAKRDGLYGTTDKGILYSYKYPSRDDITPEQLEYIDGYINKIEDEVYKGIVDNIDIESLIKYFTIQELAATYGAVWSNYLYKEREDDTLYFGPIWDYDNSFGDDYRAYPIENFTNFIFKYSLSAGTMREFVVNIFNNEDILKKFKDNWKIVSKTDIRDVLIDFIEKKYELIKDSARLNFIKWDILKRKVGFNPFAKCTYDAEVDYLKDWILKRIDQLDETFERATKDTLNEEVHGTWGRMSGGFGKFNFTKYNITNGYNFTNGFNFTNFQNRTRSNHTSTYRGFDFGGFGTLDETCMDEKIVEEED